MALIPGGGLAGARLAGRSESTDFLKSMIEYLAVPADEPLPARKAFVSNCTIFIDSSIGRLNLLAIHRERLRGRCSIPPTPSRAWAILGDVARADLQLRAYR